MNRKTTLSIRGLGDYNTPKPESEFLLISDDDSESSDYDDYEQSDVHSDGYDTESDDSTTDDDEG